jgi:hypothetical protein
MSIEWWAKGIPYGNARPKIEQVLDRATPRPGRSQNHLLGYAKDDWDLVEAVKAGQVDPQLVATTMVCQGCTVKVKVLCSRLITDNHSKWLCDDCRENGFIWGSHVMPSQFHQYTLVKEFKDDTLMRRLEGGRKSYDHDPFDPAENRRVRVSYRSETDLHKDPYDQGGEGAGGPSVPDPACGGDGPKDGGEGGPPAGGADAVPDWHLHSDTPGNGRTDSISERSSPEAGASSSE